MAFIAGQGFFIAAGQNYRGSHVCIDNMGCYRINELCSVDGRVGCIAPTERVKIPPHDRDYYQHIAETHVAVTSLPAYDDPNANPVASDAQIALSLCLIAIIACAVIAQSLKGVA